jgi:hypothetical protein
VEREAEDEQVVNLAAGATLTFAAGNAGSVSLRRDGDSLTVLAVTANPGFASEVEQASGTEIEVLPAPATATRVDNSGPGSVNSGPGDVNDDQREDVADDHGVEADDHSGSGSSGSGGSGSGHSGSGHSGSGGGEGLISASGRGTPRSRR